MGARLVAGGFGLSVGDNLLCYLAEGRNSPRSPPIGLPCIQRVIASRQKFPGVGRRRARVGKTDCGIRAEAHIATHAVELVAQDPLASSRRRDNKLQAVAIAV